MAIFRRTLRGSGRWLEKNEEKDEEKDEKFEEVSETGPSSGALKMCRAWQAYAALYVLGSPGILTH